MFESEKDLVETSIPLLIDYYAIKDPDLLVCEPNGLFGIPDVMLYNNYVISIEFKLKNWRRALVQAYRYKGFSHKSYVFLDEAYSNKALESLHEFIQSNVGLCTVNENVITFHYDPKEEKPFAPDLADKALEYFDISIESKVCKSIRR
jgi:hypothetical protein